MATIAKTRTQAVLYESEAALRLVDHELQELHDVDTMGSVDATVACDCAARFATVADEMTHVVTRLQNGRAQIVANGDHAAEQLGLAISLLHELEVEMTEVARHTVSPRD